MVKYSSTSQSSNTPMAPGPSKRALANVAPKLKWQTLVNQYGNRLGTGESFKFAQQNQSIEEEFIAYSTSRVVQTDILQFWAVSLQHFMVTDDRRETVHITPTFP